jgi:hypothetical protein
MEFLDLDFTPDGYMTLRCAMLDLVMGPELRGTLEIGPSLRPSGEAQDMLRRALSSGRLQSFYIGKDGDICALRPELWNTRCGRVMFSHDDTWIGVSTVECIRPGTALLLVDEFDTWYSTLAQRPAKDSPFQACLAWLSDLMKQSPERARPKTQLRAEAIAKFERLSWKTFDAAYTSAKAGNPAATGWGQAGRPPKSIKVKSK